jgi:hypothetical protein
VRAVPAVPLQCNDERRRKKKVGTASVNLLKPQHHCLSDIAFVFNYRTQKIYLVEPTFGTTETEVTAIPT